MNFNDLARAIVHLVLVRPLTRWVIGFNVSDAANISALKQMILVANHNSHLDTLLILSSLSLKQALRTHPVAARDYFARGRFWGLSACWLLKLITILRSGVSRNDNPIDQMSQVLNRGDNILIFPEGTRGEPDCVSVFKTGVGHLALRFPDVPLVPICVVGSGRVMGKGAAVPVPLWTSVVVGAPVWPKGRPAEIAAGLEERIRQMLDEERPHPTAPADVSIEPEVPRTPLSISVIGVDGSGKSTCYNELVTRFSLTAVATGIGDVIVLGKNGRVEEIDWVPGAFIRRTLHRLAKTATKFSRYKLCKLLELAMRSRLHDVLVLKFHPQAVVSDGHPLINIAAWGVLAYPRRFDENLCQDAIDAMLGLNQLPFGRIRFYLQNAPEVLLMRWWGRFRLPDIVLFLKVSPQTAVDRISQRGEDKQAHETVNRLARLQDAYTIVAGIVEKKYGAKVYTIDTAEKDSPSVSGEAFDLVRNYLSAPPNYGQKHR